MNFEICAIKCTTGECFFSIFFPEENKMYYNDNDIMEKIISNSLFLKHIINHWKTITWM